MDAEQLPAEAYELGELVAKFDAKGLATGNIMKWYATVVMVVSGVLLWRSDVAAIGPVLLILGLIMAIWSTRDNLFRIREVHVCAGGMHNSRKIQSDIIRWDDIIAAEKKLAIYHGNLVVVSHGSDNQDSTTTSVGPDIDFNPANVSGRYGLGAKKPDLRMTLRLRSGLWTKIVLPYEEALQLSQHIHDRLAERGFSSSVKKEWDSRQIIYYWEYFLPELAQQRELASSPAEFMESL